MDKTWPLIILAAVLTFMLVPRNVEVRVVSELSPAQMQGVVDKLNSALVQVQNKLQERIDAAFAPEPTATPAKK